MVDDTLARRVGAITTLKKQVSDADVALFALVMGEANLEAEDPPIPTRTTRQIVPVALISALLATAAAHHSDRAGGMQLSTCAVRYLEAAYTDDELTATAEISSYDAGAHALRIQARCETADGRKLAEGEYALTEA